MGLMHSLSERWVIRPALAALRHPDARLRIAAADILREQRATSAVPALAKAIGDPHPPMRLAVIAALERIGDRDAIEALVPVLADEREKVRERARRVLDQLDPEWEQSAPARAAAPRLLARVRGGCRLPRVLRLLGVLGCAEAGRDLLDLLEQTRERPRQHRDLRIAARDALCALAGQLDPALHPEARALLESQLRTRDDRLRRRLVDALRRLDPRWQPPEAEGA